MSNVLAERLEALKETIERGEDITEKALKELQQWEDEDEDKLDEMDEINKQAEQEEAEKAEESKKEKSKKPKAEKGRENMENKEKVVNEDVVKLADLAEELGIDPAVLRRKLRENKIAKPGSRWEWPKDHSDLAKIKELAAEKPKGKKAKAEEEAADEE